MDSGSFWKNRIKESAVLNPIDRIAEVLFGMIMVLTFTGAISVNSQGRQEIGELLWAALGCNVAWGIVDAIMYLMNVVFERGYYMNVLKKLTKQNDAEKGKQILKEEIQPLISNLLKEEELNHLYERIKVIPPPDKKNLITWQDALAGIQIFLLVFLCTLPVSLPFVFIQDAALALRVSNGIALVLLFIGGYKLSNYSGFKPIIGGLLYMLTGVLLVFLTMALGG
jgi:hypothetical protein